MSAVAERVKTIVADQARADPRDVHGDAALQLDLSLDGLDLVVVAMEIEAAFAIAVSNDDVETWKTVGDVVAFVRKAVAP